jgi:predicted aspartyl protease
VKSVLIAVALIFLAHSTSLGHSHASQLSQAAPLITIPFSSANNLVVITATINGQGPFRFALDTGSSVHVLNRQIAERLGLKIIGPAVADSGNKTTPAEVIEISELSAGELKLSNQRIFVTSLPASYPFDGLLGANLFEQFVVTLDFARSIVTLTPQAQFLAPRSGEIIPMKLRDRLIPEIKAEVDGHAGWFKVDTGYNGYLALFAEFVAQHKSFGYRQLSLEKCHRRHDDQRRRGQDAGDRSRSFEDQNRIPSATWNRWRNKSEPVARSAVRGERWLKLGL